MKERKSSRKGFKSESEMGGDFDPEDRRARKDWRKSPDRCEKSRPVRDHGSSRNPKEQTNKPRSKYQLHILDTVTR